MKEIIVNIQLFENEKTTAVARINLMNSPRYLITGKKTFLVISLSLISEFYDDILDKIHSEHQFVCRLESSETVLELPCKSQYAKTCCKYQLYADISHILPSEYRLCISIKRNERNHSRITILNYVSDNISIRPSEESLSFLPLVNYRNIPFRDQTYMIQEQYGKSIGSHMYDASIILLRYFEQLLSNTNYSTHLEKCEGGSLLELGSGCGLVSIALSQHFHKTYVTDLEGQMELLTTNIHLNKKDQECIPKVFDWTNVSHIRQYNQLIQDEKIEMIIACDVFYDITAAKLFLTCIEVFMENNKEIIVLVCQKCREESSDSKRFNPSLHTSLLINEVYMDGECIVYSLQAI